MRLFIDWARFDQSSSLDYLCRCRLETKHIRQGREDRAMTPTAEPVDAAELGSALYSAPADIGGARSSGSNPKVVLNLVDLNGDGIPEALAVRREAARAR
jgi:hypothetical protein